MNVLDQIALFDSKFQNGKMLGQLTTDETLYSSIFGESIRCMFRGFRQR